MRRGCAGEHELDRVSCAPAASRALLALATAALLVDASTPDLGRIRKVLRKAERSHRLHSRGRHPIWVTEIWWESDPPDRSRGVRLRKHARWVEEALYLLWKEGAGVVINLLIQDTEYDPDAPDASLQSGPYLADGRPKPALTAMRFPFVTDRIVRGRVRAWGEAPIGSMLVIERKSGGSGGQSSRTSSSTVHFVERAKRPRDGTGKRS